MTNLTLAPTIFHEDWWLNAEANGDYDVAEVLNGGHVVGRLPYRVTRRFGMKWCTHPELTYLSARASCGGWKSRVTCYENYRV
jgi:hypothetical protein